MAKKQREKAHARRLFIENGKSQKEIARALKVSENTVSVWAKEGNWKGERAARMAASGNIAHNGKLAMSNLSDILLDLQQQRAKALECETPNKNDIALLDQQIISMTHAIAQAGSQISKVLDGNKVTLTAYLQVMDEIFRAMQAEDPKLHTQTIDFQERHVQFICKKLG